MQTIINILKNKTPMKKFNEFIIEELNFVGNGSFSNAYKASKYDILKKSNQNILYEEEEINLYNIMKKRPDLFCKIYKNSKQQILLEQLDVNNFKKLYNYYYSILKDEIKNLTSLIIDLKNENPINNNKLKKHNDEFEFLTILTNYYYYWYKNYTNEEYKQLTKNLLWEDSINFITNFIHIKHEIYNYLEDFKMYNALNFDLHEGNFGFIKGTKEIRCFDPLFNDKK